MTDDERALLTFEEQHPRGDRAKEAAVRDRFGISWVRYQQILLRLVEREDVLAEFALVSHRVKRAAATGATGRAVRSFSTRAG